MTSKFQNMASGLRWPLITDHWSPITCPSPLAPRASSLITDHWPMATRHLPLYLSLLLLTLGTGCRLVQTAVNVPGQTVRAVTTGKTGQNTTDVVDVQEKLLRFADEYSVSMTLGIDKLRRGTNELDPEEALKWKIRFGTETCTIASGPNAVADVLDMTVFVTVTRLALEDYWQPKVFGPSAQPMLDSCRNSETDIWQIASTVLKPEQQAELHRAIEVWRQQNPEPGRAMAARALGFASQVAHANQSKTGTVSSVFDLINIDPLSGLDPVTREIAQTRLFAERALYVTQKMPTLLRWQTELLTIKAVDTPAVRQMVSNSTEIAVSVERFARVAEQLPGQVSAEREAILNALQSQEKNLAPLVNDVRETLTAGTQMSTSLNTTLGTFTGLMKLFGVGQPTTNSVPDTNSPPFNILDYGKTAERVGAMAKDINTLVTTVNQSVPQVDRLSQNATAEAQKVVDRAFRLGLVLIAVLLIGAVLASLVYRFFAEKLKRPAH